MIFTSPKPDEQSARPSRDDITFTSVTTIIGVLDKPALVPWAANTVADTFIADPEYWAREALRDPVETRRRLTGSRFRPPPGSTRSAAQLGTEIHALCERWAIDGRPPTWDDEIDPYMRRYGEFLDKYSPVFHAAEMVVYSFTWGYAGTCDGICEIDGTRYILDYKTSREGTDWQGKPKTPYPEVALQLAAYRHADVAAVWTPRQQHTRGGGRYYLASADEIALGEPVPEVDAGLAVTITPQHAHPHIVDCGPDVHRAFLYLIEAARWQQSLAKDVVGPVIAPPGSTVAAQGRAQ